MIQFYPTGVANEGALITELAHGKGGYLLNNRGKHVEGSGCLNEIYLALCSEGVIGSMGKTDMAFKLMRAGKMNPMHVFSEDEIERHKYLVKMIKAAQEAAIKE